MSKIEKFVSPFIPQQFPSFYKDSGPNFIAFVKAYYEWLESNNQVLDHARSLLDYNDIDTTESEFLKYFKNTYLNSLPESMLSDKRLLVKHILDLYRSKGTPRSYELLFRMLFNESIELYTPGNFIFKPSDGEWVVPRYIEVSDSPYLENLIGKQIFNSNKDATAVVESVNQKIISNRLIHVIYLSSVDGRFKYGQKILSNSVPEITLNNAPVILGSLTAVAIENGGTGFNRGDIVDVYGTGVAGKARIASVRDENGKINFNLINGGSGYSTNAVVTVATSLDLNIVGPISTFNVGDTVTSSNTSANGVITFANSSFLQLINFSTGINFYIGDLITSNSGATATVSGVIGGGGSGASFSVGGLSNKEVLNINTDYISNYLNANLSLTWAFPINLVANLNSIISSTLSYKTMEVGTIAYLTRINPGAGYSAIPYINVKEPDIVGQGFSDGSGGIKGNNAIVTSTVSNSHGVATSIQIINSGFGFAPIDTVYMSSPYNNGVVASGSAIIDTDGAGDGYWKNNKGFVSDIIKVQDSYYYQNYSYEILVNRMFDVYEKLVKDLIHPTGVALFGRFRLHDEVASDISTPSSFSLNQSDLKVLVNGNSKYLNPLLPFTRASAAWGTVDGYLTGFNTNVARFVDSPSGGYGMLVEGQRQNRITNPRFEGAVAGNPGAVGTSQAIFSLGLTNGVTIKVTGTGITNNFQWIELEFAGIATSNIDCYYLLENTAYPAVSGQTWAMSAFMRKSAGSMNSIGIRLWHRGESITGSDIASVESGNLTLTSDGLESQRQILIATPTNAQYVQTRGGIHVVILSGATVNGRVQIAAPQHEQGSVATSPILSPVGTPIATTRAQEYLSVSGINFTQLIPNTGNWSMLFEVTMDSINTNDATNFINFFDMIDGGYQNRSVLYIEPNSRNITLYSWVAGVGTGNSNFTTYSDGVKMRLAVTRNAGRMAASFNNNVPVFHTNAAGAPPGVNQMLIGNNNIRGFDRIHRIEVRPISLTDAQLQAWN